MNYFDKLPTITYNGSLCKNLLARARLSDNIRQQKEVFYPYTMDGQDRADTLSNDYYETPGYSWLIWMTNNHIDPYFDMPLSEDDFYSYVVDKHGSYELAARKIKLYRNNWYDNEEDRITVAGYAALSASQKKYYEPILDVNLGVNGYKRKKDDTVVNTNRIVSINISSASGEFTLGEEVQVDANNYGFVTSSNSSVVSVQHVSGTFTGTITGQESGTTATVSNTHNISTTIAVTDVSFWSAVTVLDYERELNEQKKKVHLLDPRYAKQAENDLRRVMHTR